MEEHFVLPPAPWKKRKKNKWSQVNFTYRPSWSGESYCDAFCWKSRWNWPLQHSQQVFAFSYTISLIRVRFEQFRKGDHLTAIYIKIPVLSYYREFFENNAKFHRKRVGPSPLSPPLNPPMSMASFSGSPHRAL